MEAFLQFISSPAGLALITHAATTAAGLIYPRVIDLVKDGEDWLGEIKPSDPLLAEGVAFVRSLLPSSLPTSDDTTALVQQLVTAEVGKLSAIDPSVSGTSAT